MIALDYPRERMLRDIGADAPVPDARAPSDERALADFAGMERARLLLHVHAPAEVLPLLSAALSARFPSVAAERLGRDLLVPLKKAVGNAHKRGNLGAPEKRITIEVIVTREGAFVEVSDEGAGFDVAATLASFRAGGAYFHHGGSGFRKFEKARAIVSFGNGGATFRTRLRADEAAAARSRRSEGAPRA